MSTTEATREAFEVWRTTESKTKRIGDRPLLSEAFEAGWLAASSARAAEQPAWLTQEIESHLLSLTALKKRADAMPVMTEWQWLNNLRNRLLAVTPPSPKVEALTDEQIDATWQTTWDRCGFAEGDRSFAPLRAFARALLELSQGKP